MRCWGLEQLHVPWLHSGEKLLRGKPKKGTGILLTHRWGIKQVHVARLHSGEEVVVKVQRPGLRALFDIDLANLKVGPSSGKM